MQPGVTYVPVGNTAPARALGSGTSSGEQCALMSQPLDSDGLGRMLGLAARGDQDAWAQLVRAYGPRVFALCQSRCHDPEVAEELTQSVFATIAVKLTTGEYAERGRFESWLFRVAMNRVRDLMRRNRRRPENLPDGGISQAAVPEGPATDRAELAALREAMEQLSPADREVIEMRHHAQMGFKQIAEVLEEPLGTLLARHHRALRKLREIMERNVPGMTDMTGGEGFVGGKIPPPLRQ